MAPSKKNIVTGASRGLGLEFVKQLAAKGETVTATAHNPTKSSELSQLADNKNVFAVKMDVNDKNSIKTTAEEISAIVPNGIDVLINNAGISGDNKLDVLTTPREECIKVFECNYLGASGVARAFLPLLRKRGQDKVKKVINISSALGSTTFTTAIKTAGSIDPAYCASKAALYMIIKLFADKLDEENIIVNSICPGWVQTYLDGEQAPIKLEDLISDMLKTIENFAIKENTGLFLNFQGNIVGF